MVSSMAEDRELIADNQVFDVVDYSSRVGDSDGRLLNRAHAAFASHDEDADGVGDTEPSEKMSAHGE